MTPNEVIIDRVIADFEAAAHPIRLVLRDEMLRRLEQYNPVWETCAVDIAENYRVPRSELVKCLRGRVELDRQMVLQTISRFIQESFAQYLVACGEKDDLASVVATVLFSLRIEI